MQASLCNKMTAAGCTAAAELLQQHTVSARPWPRTARVNTLKMSVAEALAWLQVHSKVNRCYDGAWPAMHKQPSKSAAQL